MLTLDHDQKSHHLILVDLVHIIQIQIEYLSKLYYILILSLLNLVVLINFTP
jgi:hypothetical protein